MRSIETLHLSLKLFFRFINSFLITKHPQIMQFFFQFFFLCFVQGRFPFRILKANSDKELISFAVDFLISCIISFLFFLISPNFLINSLCFNMRQLIMVLLIHLHRNQNVVDSHPSSPNTW